MRLSIDMLGVKNEQKEDDYSFMCSKLSEILVSERELKSQQSIVQNVTPEPHQPDEFQDPASGAFKRELLRYRAILKIARSHIKMIRYCVLYSIGRFVSG